MSRTLVVVVVCLCGVVEQASAQSAQSLAPQTEAVLTKLADPTYPPLARQARIMGDVNLMLTIRQDGSVESGVVVSGHPMLKQAALDSAQRSQFECRGCGEAISSYALKFKFQIVPSDPPKDCDAQIEKQPLVEIDPSRHNVTVSTWGMWTCDPTAQLVTVRFRSAKCLYLWRCGSRIED